MKLLTLTSPDALDAAVADVVRLKIQHTAALADKDAELAAIEKRHQARLTAFQDRIAELEGRVQDYCHANRATLFDLKKSRETSLAVFGFETTPPRVETTSRKITWKDVVERLLRLGWGKAYVRQAEPKTDKEALLADREKLTPEQCTAAGIQFCQDEQFFIRPKPETAQDSVREAA
jgi:phage host-nuclease inhibitor protein Gam